MSASPPPHALPYSEESAPNYVHYVAMNFELRPYDRGCILAVGTCPRCASQLEIPVALTTVRGLFRRRTRRDEPVEVPMACSCDEQHAGRPDGVEGCGAFWLLSVPTDLV